MPAPLPGFNLLRGPRPAAARDRSHWLGLALGLSLAATWLAGAREELHRLQARAQPLQAQLAQLQQARHAALEQARQQQAAWQAQEDLRALQVRQLRWLAVLEELAGAPHARLSLLRLDEHGLLLHGQLPADGLQAWAQARATPATGLRSPELLELSAGAGAGAAAVPARFVLRWPQGPGEAGP